MISLIKYYHDLTDELLQQSDVLKLQPCDVQLDYSGDSENAECRTIAALVRNVKKIGVFFLASSSDHLIVKPCSCS